MASISNLGVGSNLDLGALYDQLEAAEKTKLTAIAKQRTTYDAQLSAYGKLQSALQNLQTATAALGKASTWNSTQVTSTNTAFSAVTTSEASVGSYTVNVNQVAKAQVLTSGTIPTNNTQLGETTGATRTITITQPGTEKPLTVELSDKDTSLNGIAKAINAANGNVSASVIKASDGDYRLLLTSKTTGVDSAMTVEVTGDETLNGIIGSDAMQVQTEAQNAIVNVNGIEIERQSNTISDALPGVTFTIKAQSTANETLDITRATEANQKAVNAWVTAYNALQSTIGSVTKYTSVEAGAESQASGNGALLGDSSVRSIQQQLRGLLTVVQEGSAGILAELGITQDPLKGADGSTGNLKVDNAKLTKMLTDNPDAMQQYFVGDGKTTGLATMMDKTLTSMLDTRSGNTGVIQNAKDGINSTIKSLEKRYVAMEATIEATMARYKAQFTNLDKMMSSLNSTSAYLTQQFAPRSN